MAKGSRATKTAMFRLLVTSMVLAACDPVRSEQGLAPEAAALLAEVRAADYRSWARPPEWPQRASGRAPHGLVSEVFIDPTIARALERGDPILAWPEGSTLVCDGYDDEESLAAIQIMRKRNGAWTWAQYGADDTPRVYAEGSSALACSHCHAAGHDFVRTLELPE